jgi:hypothetical protein
LKESFLLGLRLCGSDLKGLTFRVDQLPELIRALLQAHNKAMENGLLSPDIPSDQLELSGKS